MSRLTYKRGRGMLIENNIEYGTLTNVCYQNCVDKLGQLEDIEDELGISSVTLFKALKEGFVDENEEYHHFSNLFIDNIEIFDSYEKVSFNLKDYGKTWALTREELEK